MNHRMLYNSNPDYAALVDQLTDLMETYRWSSGDHSHLYEEMWHGAINLAEKKHHEAQRNAHGDTTPCGATNHNTYGESCPCVENV